MTLTEIQVRHEQLFAWAEREFKERLENSSGDPMEAAMVMEACLTSLAAIQIAVLK